MKHFENIVIGKPIVDPQEIFAKNKEDWETVEKEQTFFTEERRMSAILKEIGVVGSVSEVRRNKPILCQPFEGVDFQKIKWGKNIFFVLIGE